MNKVRRIAALLLVFVMGCTALPGMALAETQTEQMIEEAQAESEKPDIQKKKAKSQNAGIEKKKTVKSSAKTAKEEKKQSDFCATKEILLDRKIAQPKENTENSGAGKSGGEIDSTGENSQIDIDLSVIEDVMQADMLYPVWNMPGSDAYLVYLFIPESSGYYTFFSEGPYDTYGMIFDEEGYLVNENDDRDYDNGDCNFAVSKYLFSGSIYYCVAQMFDSRETGYYHCMISSSRTSYHLDEEDIQKFEITDFPREQFYKPEADISYMPIEGCEYCITFTSGQKMRGMLSSNVVGLPVTVSFKYPSAENEEIPDSTREDNALIYSIAGIDAEEIPINFAESPIAELEIITNPNVTEVGQINTENKIEILKGLKIRIHYTDGSKNILYCDEDGVFFDEDDQVDAYPTWIWKRYDEDGAVELGENAVIISYLDQSLEIPITVMDSSVDSLSIVKNPTKMYYGIYEYGEDIDLYGLVLRIVYGDESSEQVTITEHGRFSVIGKYQLPVEAFFEGNENKYLTGEIVVMCQETAAYYKPVLQTYADLRKEAVHLMPGQITRVSLDQNTVYRVFRFTPLRTRTYEFYTLGDCDTYLDVLGTYGNLLANDDDSGMDQNCYISGRFEAGRTYYFVVSMLETGEIGNFACKLAGAIAYTVTYNLNGGVNHPSNPTLHYNQTIPLRNPSRSQYLFEGWYTDSAYRNRITQITAGSTQNYVLYAKWKKVTVPGKVKLTSASNNKAKKISVKFKKVKKAEGYEIVYATNKKFKKAASITAKKTKATIGKLKKGKTYYVRVCAYNLDSTGQKIRGKWSSAKRVFVKK